MKDPIRVFLIDPVGESRRALQKVFGAIDALRVVGECETYQGAAKRVAENAPDLVVVAIDDDPEQAVSLIQTIAQNYPKAVVLPASRSLDSSIILRVIRSGAREFLSLPPQSAEVLETVNRLFNRREEAPALGDGGPQVIAVAGAAGGVGCTTVAVNLAATLAKTSGHETILVDFDLMLGSVDACLDIMTESTLQGLVQSIDRLDLTLLKRSLVRHSSGLYVLPHPTAMEDAAKIEPETLRRVMTLLKAAFPTVVIDTSKGLQSTDFIAYEMADVILVVVQLDLTCLRNTARLLHLFQQFDGMSQRIRLVANRAGSRDSEISLKKAEETLKMPIYCQVPNSSKVFQAARAKGVTIETVAPGSKAHQAILQCARPLQPHAVAEVGKPKKGIFAALF